MPLIFNSVTKFYEQIGRRQTHVSNPTQLDSLECIFVGDQTGTASVCPGDLARHPDFPGMQCSGWDITRKEALMAEVRARYSGKFGAGAGPYIGTPLITRSRQLGAISYTTTQTLDAVTLATKSYQARYTAKAVAFKYLTNRAPVPGFEGNFVSQADPYLGVENIKTFQTSLAYTTGAPFSGYTVAELEFDNDLVDVQINDQGNGWFDVTESYLTQAKVNSFVEGTPSLIGTVTTSFPAFTGS